MHGQNHIKFVWKRLRTCRRRACVMKMMTRTILLVMLACELRWKSIKPTRINTEIKPYIFLMGYSAFTTWSSRLWYRTVW